MKTRSVGGFRETRYEPAGRWAPMIPLKLVHIYKPSYKSALYGFDGRQSSCDTDREASVPRSTPLQWSLRDGFLR
jgi:hypothetical protein